ncbi:hypothetical protein GCM10009557_44310 [Virgisporangium ochraceum]
MPLIEVEVPPTAAALIASRRMPAWLAAGFDPAQTLSPFPDWADIADTIEAYGDSADPSLRGVLALMTAYGRIDRAVTVLDRLEERTAEILGLCDLAVANGIDEDEVEPLRAATEELEEIWPDGDDTAGDDGRPGVSDLLAAADAAYAEGDRAGALARYRDLAAADAQALGGSGVYAITYAWTALIADAAEHEGAAAAGALWRAARARNEWFPWPGAGGALIRGLLGRDLADLVAEAVAIRRNQSWHLRRLDREAIAAAEAELSRTGR